MYGLRLAIHDVGLGWILGEEKIRQMIKSVDGEVRKVAVIGTYSPRQCGIATFTSDLAAALERAREGLECVVVAMNDRGRHYDYPPEVEFQIDQDDVTMYRECATYLNSTGVDVVCVQHEYGIFGGDAGSYILELLRHVRAPIVVTLHTVLEDPNPGQRLVVERLAELASKLVVMSARGARMLVDIHGVPPWKIQQIPHGVHASQPMAGSSQRKKLNLGDSPVMLTFGLLSPDKGIEYVIEGMPRILEVEPEASYVVVGATHPHIRAHSGEAYRESLEARTRDLGIEGNVVFLNEFVSLSELTGFLSMADIYVTPYLKREQITSGTLAYAVGSGKAVISTPYWYAEELLAEGRGILVPPRDSNAFADAAIELLRDADKRKDLEERALRLGMGMQWPAVGAAYLKSFDDSRASGPKKECEAVAGMGQTQAAGKASFAHLLTLTDDTGIIQHATHNIPNRSEGYCLDDNARALLFAALGRELASEESDFWDVLENRYLAFVYHAFNPATRTFRNFMSYDREWLETRGSEDSNGRALWALGTSARKLKNVGRSTLAHRLFFEGLPSTLRFTSPRAWAYTLLGIDEVLRTNPASAVAVAVGEQLASRLMSILERVRTANWNWFELALSYDNARLPEALLASGRWMENPRMVEAALESLDWLSRLQSDNRGRFEPVGSERIMRTGELKPKFDQQPIEACAGVSSCLRAWRATRDAIWRERAVAAYAWFTGGNSQGLTMIDEVSGGCYDGLQAHGVNRNQGAESTLSYHLARLDMVASELAVSARSVPLVHSR